MAYVANGGDSHRVKLRPPRRAIAFEIFGESKGRGEAFVGVGLPLWGSNPRIWRADLGFSEGNSGAIALVPRAANAPRLGNRGTVQA